MIKSIYDTLFNEKRVLVRVDFNVPFDSNGKISDDTRISAALTTIDKIIDDGGIPVLCSHLGRPKGIDKKFSLKPVADYLADVFGYKVHFVDDCIGDSAKKSVEAATPGEIILLENLRFYKEEEANDLNFAKQLSELADCYVNDAFGAAHRAHASTEAVAHLFEERYAGALMINELDYLNKAVKNPIKPMTAVIGGSKVSGKIDVITNLMEICDTILIGGGMMFTFYKAQGLEIGKSILESDKIELAKEILEKAKTKNVKLLLPKDVLVADKFENEANIKSVAYDNMPNDMIGMDIGEETIKMYSEIITNSKTIVWNGPMGVFEMSNFAKGTNSIAYALVEATKKGAITIVGGGDSSAAITQLDLEKSISHLSTGGGASLEFLEGKTLPGVAALDL